jgi:hypothetical protein
VSKVVCATLVWDAEKGEGEVVYYQAWRRSPWIVKADALVDWVGTLKRDYEAHVSDGVKPKPQGKDK